MPLSLINPVTKKALNISHFCFQRDASNNQGLIHLREFKSTVFDDCATVVLICSL